MANSLFRCYALTPATLQAAFAERVKQLAERGFTQREIAEELGVSPATVNRCLKAKNEEERP